jgi:hypothetical protein
MGRETQIDRERGILMNIVDISIDTEKTRGG